MPAATALHDVTPATLKAWLERAEAILVDVREADEYAREPIAGARRHPLLRLMAAPLPRVTGKKLVLRCHSGSRTRQAAAAILAREPDRALPPRRAASRPGRGTACRSRSDRAEAPTSAGDAGYHDRSRHRQPAAVSDRPGGLRRRALLGAR